AIYLREGRRGRSDDVLEDFNHTSPLEGQEPPIGLFNPELIVPGAQGAMISRIGSVIDRDMFSKLMDDYYSDRGWDVQSGLPTKKCFERLGLTDIAPELERAGCLL
ncbi:MAG: aldehyde ferredoxin oxidoreductase C-terminal domain-containing protein, partial [Pseudomonadota bacterium]